MIRGGEEGVKLYTTKSTPRIQTDSKTCQKRTICYRRCDGHVTGHTICRHTRAVHGLHSSTAYRFLCRYPTCSHTHVMTGDGAKLAGTLKSTSHLTAPAEGARKYKVVRAVYFDTALVLLQAL